VADRACLDSAFCDAALWPSFYNAAKVARDCLADGFLALPLRPWQNHVPPVCGYCLKWFRTRFEVENSLTTSVLLRPVKLPGLSIVRGLFIRIEMVSQDVS
jgi:hypothetical protein